MWLSFGGVKSQNEFVAPDLVEAKLRVMVAEILENRNFHGKLTLRAVFGLKIAQGSSLARFQCLAARPRIITCDSWSGSAEE